MTKAEAKRHACWLAAGWIEGSEDAGASLHVDDEDGPEQLKVSQALVELVDELSRRGEFYRTRRKAP